MIFPKTSELLEVIKWAIFEYEAFKEDCGESLDLTIGWTPINGTWGYQTGDNSFTGAAYGHPIWAVASLDDESDPEAVVTELLDQLAEQVET